MKTEHDILDVEPEPIGSVAERVVEKAGQSLATREAQNNLPAAITPMAMLDRAVANNASMETLEKLMALQERWEANQARKAFDAAMASAKAEIGPIVKNRIVDFTGKTGVRTHYRHEDLAEIARTVNPILAKHGLSYRYRTSSPPNEPVTVTCIVSHRDGYSEENSLTAGRDDSGNKNSIQQIGSTITFLQRYTLKAALGLAASNDDDGAMADKTTDELATITLEQIAILQDLIDETETDIAKFCEFAHIEALADIYTSKFEDVKRMLERKKAAMQKGALA